MRELKGWHVLVMILAFFGVTIGVNTVFVSYALSTFSGEDVKQPYLKGLAYNQTLSARAAQAHLGWTAVIEGQRVTDGTALIRVAIADRNRQELAGLEVTATLRHPVNARLDRDVSLLPASGGRYEVRVKDLARGQWDVIVQARSTGQVPFEASRRVVMP